MPALPRPCPYPVLKRLTTAPNLALAQLWADMLTQSGIPTSVQRAFASSLSGGVPPDQTLPELWVDDEADHARAVVRLHELQHPRRQLWACPQCHEVIDGPFEQCWNCGAAMPTA